MTTRNYLLILVLILFTLLFLKTDYRLEEDIYCCKDDHDYFAHAETISIDFDFNYSNQFEGFETERFYYKGKTAPIGFFGSGLLASPFLLIGNLVDKIITNSNLYNFKILLYSLSSIFYLFFSFSILLKIQKLVNNTFNPFLLYLFLIGSGVIYFAFERYSMSHIYEVFSILLLILYSIKFYTSENINSKYAIYIPLSILLALLVRWVNVYVVLIPLIVKLLFFEKSIKLHKSKLFIFSCIFSCILFCLHSYLIYGVVSFNPEFVYGFSGTLETFLNENISIVSFVLNNLLNFINILFGYEFGLIWFSPIVFFGLYLLIKETFFSSNNAIKQKLVYLLGILCYFQIFSIILIWKTTASSYGFRYAMNLAPLAILYLIASKNINRYEMNILKYLSIFSAFSVLFFETNIGTQLSTEYITNSFGKVTKFSQPNYLIGYINSFVDLESYLKIFAQSYLGFVFFGLVFKFVSVDNFISFLSNFSQSAYNSDLQNLFFKIKQIEVYKVLIVIVIISFLVINLMKDTSKFKSYS